MQSGPPLCIARVKGILYALWENTSKTICVTTISYKTNSRFYFYRRFLPVSLLPTYILFPTVYVHYRNTIAVLSALRRHFDHWMTSTAPLHQIRLSDEKNAIILGNLWIGFSFIENAFICVNKNWFLECVPGFMIQISCQYG